MKTVGVFDNLKITEWEVEPLNGERDKKIIHVSRLLLMKLKKCVYTAPE